MKAAQRDTMGRAERHAAALANRMRALFLGGAFEAGDHLRAQDLADRLQISRYPISVALKELAQQGVVRHEPHRGYFLVDASSGGESATGIHPLEGAYEAVAADHLAGRLPERVATSFLRERYALTAAELSDLMTRIVAEGWAQRRTGTGWAFLPILRTPDVLLQTYRVRQAIEPAALLEPTFRISAQELDRLARREEEILAGAADTLSAEALYDAGVDFHESLMRASGNPFFAESLARVNTARRLISYRSMVDRRRYYAQSRAHLAIIEHVRAGDLPAAARLMSQHLADVASSLENLRWQEEAPAETA